jgi:glycosyltransferase involved in cell wall biosynthesis
MPVFFDLADGLLVTLSAEEIFSYTVPSKVQTYLAAGKPIIAALDGEGARLINEAEAGLTCAAEDVDGLVHNIESLYNMSEEEKVAMGSAGKRYFAENFDMEKQSRRLIDIIQNRTRVTERK